MRQSREHLRQKDAKADKCTKENYKQSFPNPGKCCNFFGWLSICFTGNLGHKKRNLIRFEPLPILQIPPNLVSNLTGGNGQESLHRTTSGRPSAPCLLLPSQRGHRRAKRRGAGAARTPERGGLRTWPPLPQTRHLTSASRCLALPGTRRPALPSACSSRPAPQELSRGPGPSHGARTGLLAGLTSYSPRLGGGCGREGGTEGRGRLPLPRGAGPPSRAPPQGRMGPGRARLPPPAAVRRCPAACPMPRSRPGALAPGAWGGDGVPRLPCGRAPLEPGDPGSGPGPGPVCVCGQGRRVRWLRRETIYRHAFCSSWCFGCSSLAYSRF